MNCTRPCRLAFARLLLHAAARLNPQRIVRDELQYHLTEAVGWSASEFQRRLDACLDLHVLQDGVELRMHQLFAAFIIGKPASDEIAAPLKQVVWVQARRMIEISRELATDPSLADLAAKLLNTAITNFGENPVRLYDHAKGEPVTPLEEVVSKLPPETAAALLAAAIGMVGKKPGN